MTGSQGKYTNSRDYFLVYRELINAAHYRGTITYPDVAVIMELLPRGNQMARETGQILGEISENEHRQGRPMLSALAVKVNEGVPGPGFFECARGLGVLKGNSAADERRFWEEQKTAVYETWQRKET